jgi:hypothetical protein
MKVIVQKVINLMTHLILITVEVQILIVRLKKNNIIIKMIKNNKFNYNHLLALFPFSLFNINIIPETTSSFDKFLFSLIILGILTLWSFIDIVGHFIVLYLIDHKKIEEKYPRFRFLIKYFKKVNYYFLTFEIVFFISVYLMLIGICIILIIFK